MATGGARDMKSTLKTREYQLLIKTFQILEIWKVSEEVCYYLKNSHLKSVR